jgi:ribosomal protein S18 acetylase RimI-like enzyme
MCYCSDMPPAETTRTGLTVDARTTPEFRLANIRDVQETYKVYVTANEALNRQLGRPADLEKHTLPTRALAVRSNALLCDPERFWVADFGGKIGGFGLATRRRTLWYLAALHVLPEFQGLGIGAELVRRCLGSFDPGDSPTMLTTSDSANPVSTGMYLRLGLMPQTAIIQLQGLPRSLGPQDVVLRLADGPAAEESLNRVDKTVLGEIRPEDHQCWATVSSMIPYLVFEKDRMVGYIYVDREGALGPAAVERPELLPGTISAALETYAANQSAPVQIRVPSDARETLSTLFSHGINCITEVRLLLTSRRFGLFDRYLFSGADALI